MDERPLLPPGWSADAHARLMEHISLHEAQRGRAADLDPTVCSRSGLGGSRHAVAGHRRLVVDCETETRRTAHSGHRRQPRRRHRESPLRAGGSAGIHCPHLRDPAQAANPRIAARSVVRRRRPALCRPPSPTPPATSSSKRSGGPAGGREFIFRATEPHPELDRPRHTSDALSLAALADAGLDPDQIQAAFLRWLEGRPWSPISFAAQYTLWTAEDGVVPTLERLPASDGAPALRLTVRRQTPKLSTVLTVDVDSVSYHPRLETIRFLKPLTGPWNSTSPCQRCARSANPTSRRRCLNRPPSSLRRYRRRARRAPPRSRPWLRWPISSTGLPPAESREIEAIYALHKAGACIGQPVRVSEEPGGARVVRVGSQDAGIHITANLENRALGARRNAAQRSRPRLPRRSPTARASTRQRAAALIGRPHRPSHTRS